jgi:hypothetical protein
MSLCNKFNTYTLSNKYGKFALIGSHNFFKIVPCNIVGGGKTICFIYQHFWPLSH